MIEYWERRYRTLYWEKNELQIIAGDPTTSTKLFNNMIDECEVNMNECIRNLGYIPAT